MSRLWFVPGQLNATESMSTSKKVITREEWEKKLMDVKIRKEDMNKLVMNFLVTEGYVEAAEKFRMESGTQPEIDLATITDRMAVKKAVQSGNVQDAIEKVNDLNPESILCVLEIQQSLLWFITFKAPKENLRMMHKPHVVGPQTIYDRTGCS
ncbi:hypothetical protein KSP40_PGU012223 [Platanthera guangdongensis]|uniref:CTLH domain-containing protein n=1 Tax=Platanthera guangdongensis TaxID=2320717 RepID=A0ABR2LHN0_9ASPA